MDNIEPKCIRCKKWEDKQEKVLSSCESVFDAHFDMMMFESDCIKTCPYLETE